MHKRTTDVPSLTHEYFTHTESDAKINKNIAPTLVMIIVRNN